MVGFVALTGIATRNGILKISHYINLALHEGVPFGPDLVIRGTLERLTPVLMTALSACVALFPLLIDASSPGKEILHPVAVTIFGGLISATILDAILIPVEAEKCSSYTSSALPAYSVWQRAELTPTHSINRAELLPPRSVLTRMSTSRDGPINSLEQASPEY
jgi:hypothetical protein